GVEPAGAVVPAAAVSFDAAVPAVDVSFDAAVPDIDESAGALPLAFDAPPPAMQTSAAAAAADDPQERSTWPLLAWSTDQRAPARRGRLSIAIAAAALVCLVAGAAVLWSGSSSQPVANSAAPAASGPTETND